MNIEILNNLIIEGENLTNSIQYVPAPSNVIRAYAIYKSTQPEDYQNWQATVLRFIKTYHPSDLEEVQKVLKIINNSNHIKLLGILRAIKILPKEPVKELETNASINHINITNNQSNSQKITFNVFIEAIKDELTGKQIKEIQEIIKTNEHTPTETRGKIIDKIKSFGSDTLSNIIANIITNPSIYKGFI